MTSWKDATVGDSRVEMGRHHYGFYHKASQECLHSGFYLGHRGSIDQERAFHLDAGMYYCKEVGRDLCSGGGGTSRGVGVSGFRPGCLIYFKILEAVS